MFLHHTMTDQEILRTCEGCDSQHLRLVADRLRARVEDLRTIATLSADIPRQMSIDTIWSNMEEIQRIAKGE